MLNLGIRGNRKTSILDTISLSNRTWLSVGLSIQHMLLNFLKHLCAHVQLHSVINCEHSIPFHKKNNAYFTFLFLNCEKVRHTPFCTCCIYVDQNQEKKTMDQVCLIMMNEENCPCSFQKYQEVFTASLLYKRAAKACYTQRKINVSKGNYTRPFLGGCMYWISGTHSFSYQIYQSGPFIQVKGRIFMENLLYKVYFRALNDTTYSCVFFFSVTIFC